MTYRKSRKGAALLISMIVLAILSAWAVSICSMSGTGVQLAENQRRVNSALSAAQSGLECGKYLVVHETLPYLESTSSNFVTDTQADTVWVTLCDRVQVAALAGNEVPAPTRFTDSTGSGDQIVTQYINFGSNEVAFAIRFYRYDGDPHTIKLQSKGTANSVTRHINIDMEIGKGAEVLEYAIAGRGRMWLTGDSTIHGDIFSSWDRPEISPFNMTSGSSVLGTINTVLTQQQIADEGYQLETLDENGNPMFDEDGNRIYSPEDEVQAYYEGINYDQQDEGSMPGMDIADYDTDEYKDTVMGGDGNGDIPSSSTIETEYFPHAAGDYTQPKSGSSRELDRHVYDSNTFTDVRLPDDRDALFRNCTFDGILYIDCSESGYSNYNNVRFENCTFNGAIVTNVPQRFKWKNNCLYFTEEATFNNTSEIQEATILAPHFNVNLGNTNPVASDNNVLTGAIVGGIVDVRGNAQIYGTIISMCDTTQWSSGYVTNIGATLDDGGSETTEAGDVGVISITPEEDKMLPSGITSPIVIKPLQSTYSEGF